MFELKGEQKLSRERSINALFPEPLLQLLSLL